MADIVTGTSPFLVNAYSNKRNDSLTPVNPLLANTVFAPPVVTSQNTSEALKTRLENNLQVKSLTDTPFQPKEIQFANREIPGKEINQEEINQVLRSAIQPIVTEVGRNIINNLDKDTVRNVGTFLGITDAVRNRRVSGSGDIGGVNVSGSLDLINNRARLGTQQNFTVAGRDLNVSTDISVSRGNIASANLSITNNSSESSTTVTLGNQNGQTFVNLSLKMEYR